MTYILQKPQPKKRHDPTKVDNSLNIDSQNLLDLVEKFSSDVRSRGSNMDRKAEANTMYHLRLIIKILASIEPTH
jgi:hypothetical protein